MAFLVRECAGALAHVAEGRAEDAGTDLPAPRALTVKAGATARLRLLEHCDTDCDAEFAVVPRSSFAKTPLQWEEDVAWRTRGCVVVRVRNAGDADFAIAAGDRLFQLITRDLRHMRVAAPLGAPRHVLCARTDRAAGAARLDDDLESGRTLLVTLPRAVALAPGARARVDLGVAAVWLCGGRPHAFLMAAHHPDAALANGVGVIDAGYRGPLIAVLENRTARALELAAGDAVVRLERPLVEGPDELRMVGADDPLFAPGATARGAGAFGSTGL